MEFTYESYAHWRAEMTENAKLTLDESYCKKRIEALSDDEDPSTSAFLKAYGAPHRDQVLSWFEQTLAEL
ncbi:MAG: hypothetical protein CMN02_13480 [Roseibacillus sp.]|nr:hypothetical protein [Roseibacillus sp.]|tara:strand:+ start:3061 stop:3270 length:210 start_codon:yes stop_codon:yes gene_type:complete